MKTVIVGGGASGLAAAITLKRETPDMEVFVLEKLAEPGRKILATGNGRCNLSNKDIDVSCYHGDSPTVYHVLRNFGTEECMDFFHSLGLLTLEEEGRIYPLSMNAATVRNVLLQEANRLGVKFETNRRVKGILPEGTGENPQPFLLYTEEGSTIAADAVLLALGGKADAAHGTDGDGYPILKQLGIRYAPISPALVSILTEDSIKPLKGLRFRGTATLVDEEWNMLGREEGELQFTDRGLSGIPAFQLSGDVAVLSKHEELHIILDFCPALPDTAVLEYLNDRMYSGSPHDPARHLLTGMLQDKLADFLLTAEGIGPADPVITIQPRRLANLAGLIKGFPLEVTGTKKFKDAQVTRGGVPADELKESSLESRKVPGLFFAGELLNVDGACGGYNLHFAWGSGILAAKEISNCASY